MLDQPTVEPVRLAELTSEIVSAYVTNNSLASSELPSLIDTVARSMAAVGAPVEEPPATATPEPVVSVRRSIQPSHLLCLVCGRSQKTLKRHINVAHALTPVEYRHRYGLKADYPMVAPEYAEQRRQVALQAGLGTRQPAKLKKRTRKTPAPAPAAAPVAAA